MELQVNPLTRSNGTRRGPSIPWELLGSWLEARSWSSGGCWERDRKLEPSIPCWELLGTWQEAWSWSSGSCWEHGRKLEPNSMPRKPPGVHSEAGSSGSGSSRSWVALHLEAGGSRRECGPRWRPTKPRVRSKSSRGRSKNAAVPAPRNKRTS